MNVLWGLFNLAVAYALLIIGESAEPQHASRVAVAAAGFGLASLGLARSLSRLHV